MPNIKYAIANDVTTNDVIDNDVTTNDVTTAHGHGRNEPSFRCKSDATDAKYDGRISIAINDDIVNYHYNYYNYDDVKNT